MRLAHQMAVESDLVTGDMVEASEFPHLVNKYSVMGVPKTVINETYTAEGSRPEADFLDLVLKAAQRDEAPQAGQPAPAAV